MRKSFKKMFISLLATCTIVTGMIPASAQAKAPKLSKSSVKMYVGKKNTIRIVNHTGNVKWSSSNKEVAALIPNSNQDSVTVRALQKGNAVIKATTADGRKLQCTVNVKNPSLNMTKKRMKAGRTFMLRLTGATVKSYTSDNTKVAWVTSKGEVTANREGSAVIKVTDTLGRTYLCTVEVMPEKTPKKELTVRQKRYKEERERWISENITEDMNDVQKVKRVLAFLVSWTYGKAPSGDVPTNITRIGNCYDGAKVFADYCNAAGLRAEVWNVPDEMLKYDEWTLHACTHVWIDGVERIVNSTPENTAGIIFKDEKAYSDYFLGKDISDSEYEVYRDDYREWFIEMVALERKAVIESGMHVHDWQPSEYYNENGELTLKYEYCPWPECDILKLPDGTLMSKEEYEARFGPED